MDRIREQARGHSLPCESLSFSFISEQQHKVLCFELTVRILRHFSTNTVTGTLNACLHFDLNFRLQFIGEVWRHPGQPAMLASLNSVLKYINS